VGHDSVGVDSASFNALPESERSSAARVTEAAAASLLAERS
jgi:hypothetical protein